MSMQEVIIEPTKIILAQVGQFVIKVLLVVLILLIGWIIARIVKTLVVRLLRAIRVDEFADRLELDNLLEKGGLKYSLTELIGVIFYWIVILVTFVVAMNAMQLTVAADLLNRIVLYIPNIIAAIFVLLLGLFVASFLKNVVQTASTNAGVAQANLVSKLVETVVVVFAVAIALEQLGIGAKIIELTISIILASLGLGLAIAFGLGCKDIVGRYVGEFIDKIKK
jgi:putative Mn2+ efflux pump MntP